MRIISRLKRILFNRHLDKGIAGTARGKSADVLSPASGNEPCRRSVFKEGRWKAEVEILEDNSDAACERYKLKVIRTLGNAYPDWEPPADGTVFTVEQRIDVEWGRMWSLYSDPLELGW